MPHPELAFRKQRAVLWAASGYDAHGQAKVVEPVEIRVRWETVRAEALDPLGNTVALSAAVVVDRQIAVGSILWKGTLNNWYSLGSAGNDSELHQVVNYEEIPDVKNRVARREVMLMRYRDTLPELA